MAGQLDKGRGVGSWCGSEPVWMVRIHQPRVVAEAVCREQAGRPEVHLPRRGAVADRPDAEDLVEGAQAAFEVADLGGLFSLTMHPFVSGRPARAAALERLIERAAAIDGLWLAAGDEIAAWVEGLDLPPVLHERPDVDR